MKNSGNLVAEDRVRVIVNEELAKVLRKLFQERPPESQIALMLFEHIKDFERFQSTHNEQLNGVDKHLNAIDRRFDEVDKRFDGVATYEQVAEQGKLIIHEVNKRFSDIEKMISALSEK